jgi:hypothetical protein
MKTLRRLCVALMFTFALTLPTFAGEITTMIAPPPAQPSQAATTQGEISTPVAGQMDTGSSEATVAGSATEVALNLLQSVLALF